MRTARNGKKKLANHTTMQIESPIEIPLVTNLNEVQAINVKIRENKKTFLENLDDFSFLRISSRLISEFEILVKEDNLIPKVEKLVSKLSKLFSISKNTELCLSDFLSIWKHLENKINNKQLKGSLIIEVTHFN